MTLVVAAVIDGLKLESAQLDHVPDDRRRLGLLRLAFGGEGLLWSVVGTPVGLALLLPAYAIGGMGAGNVKLLGRRGGMGRKHDHVLRLLRLGHSGRRDCRGHGSVPSGPGRSTTTNSG